MGRFGALGEDMEEDVCHTSVRGAGGMGRIGALGEDMEEDVCHTSVRGEGEWDVLPKVVN